MGWLMTGQRSNNRAKEQPSRIKRSEISLPLYIRQKRKRRGREIPGAQLSRTRKEKV